MEKLAAKFRAEVAQQLGGRRPSGRCYGPRLRRLALACAREGVAVGLTRTEIAAHLGVHGETLRGWLHDDGLTNAPTTALVPIRLVSERTAVAPTVHGPCGLRIEGLDVSALAELLRALG